jgi:uncharacterized repeat protein (TIGR01451 family)
VTVPVALTLEGDGAAASIVDGGDTVRLFLGGANDISVIDVTLQNGSAAGSGGAISTTGTVTALRSVFSSNQAVFDGGAIFGSVVLATDSSFVGNTAGGPFGGAIRAAGSGATIVRSTFSGNTVDGGGFEPVHGGAINTPGNIVATNSTFTANTATTGGALIAGGTITVTNSTFHANIAGFRTALEAGGAVTLTNTVIAGGTSTNCSGGSFTDGGGNFSTDATCGLTQLSSQVVVLADLALQPLADNGGPTETIGLGATSVAIDAGTGAGCPATDQRGISRPQGAACDAGAFELVVAPPPPPPPPVSPVATLTLSKGVSASQAGPFGSSLTAALGSTVWYQVRLTNIGTNPLTDIALVDSAASGALPPGCPALPTSLAGAASYTCTYSGVVASGTKTNTATATRGGAGISAVTTVTAGPPVLTDAIAPGVNRGSSGFGTSSVILDQPGYVTFLVRLDPSLAGQKVELWTRTKTGAWVLTTSRLVAADGTVHYYRRISAWTGIWAKLADGASHGRIGTVR